MLISYKRNSSKVCVAELQNERLEVIKTSNEDLSVCETVLVQKPYPKVVGLIIFNEFCERYMNFN
jgi:hypothetical protein